MPQDLEKNAIRSRKFNLSGGSGNVSIIIIITLLL